LQDVATRAQIHALVAYTDDEGDKERLLALTGDDPVIVAHYRDVVLNRRVSVLDLLEAFPSCAVPFNIFLEMLPPLRPRYYSISSSPLVDAAACTITVAVVDGPARSGRGSYHGVCSTYLAGQDAGSTIAGFVRDPSTPFRLPPDPATPLIMIGPGTGLAPFRGFLQERAALRADGKTLGEALLFFGCRRPDQDFIYRDELEAFDQQGIVKLVLAFSRIDTGNAYVQDKIRENAAAVWQIVQNGGYVYVCGDASKMAPDVRRAFATIYREQTSAGDTEAEAWLGGLAAAGRYVADVWAAT
jgi:cytochrome P450/NADPH-cytochrome P450 reductase